MTEKSTISEDYKELGTSNITSSKTEHGPGVNRQTTRDQRIKRIWE